jgi:hypothetical protein
VITIEEVTGIIQKLLVQGFERNTGTMLEAYFRLY